MTEQPAHELFDFTQMPIPNEQRILDTLIRIEQLLINRFGVGTPTQDVAPIETLITDITPSKTPFMAAVRKGRK